MCSSQSSRALELAAAYSKIKERKKKVSIIYVELIHRKKRTCLTKTMTITCFTKLFPY